MNQPSKVPENQAIQPNPPKGDVGLATTGHLLGFLFGRADSIRWIVTARGALILGAVLVATAAFAREYDAVSLLHEPQDLLAPFGASLVLATILYVWTFPIRKKTIASKHGQPDRNLVADFGVFLTGYWLTAPLAYFYAIPVEAMTDEVTAVRLNLLALSVVSIWRVLLFSRFVQVQYRLQLWVALTWVLIPSMAIAFIALMQRVLSVVAIMGGLRLSDAETVARNFSGGALQLILFASPVVLLAWIVSLFVRPSWHDPADKSKADQPSIPDAKFEKTVRVGKSLWAVPVVAMVVLLFGLWHFQPRLYDLTKVDTLLAAGEIDRAIETLEGIEANSIPKTWDPPPHFPSREDAQPDLIELAYKLDASNLPNEVRNRLLEKFCDLSGFQLGQHYGTGDLWFLESRIDGMIADEPETLARWRKALEIANSFGPSDENEAKAQREIMELIDNKIAKGDQSESELESQAAQE